MLTQRDIEHGLRSLGLEGAEVLVHSSFRSFGGVEGGPVTVVRALRAVASTVLMPAFTYEAEVWDPRGDFPGNAYRAQPEPGRQPAVFTAETPVSREIGVIPETFRTQPGVLRSRHPGNSFLAAGPAAHALLDDHPYDDQLEPIRRLWMRGGYVLLLGVTHTSSTAVHLAEVLEGRPLFVRYALTPDGVVECRGGGDSGGFDALQPHVEHVERRVAIGGCVARAYALAPYLEAARGLIRREPNALLCGRCERCLARWTGAPPPD